MCRAEEIAKCMITPRSAAALAQHLRWLEDNTTIPVFMLSEQSVCPFAEFECHECRHGIYLNKCNTLLFTIGPPSTSCRMLKRGFARAFLSCFLSACHKSLKSNL